MLAFLIKKFVKNSADTQNREVRAAYTTLAGVLGMVCNFVLFALKLGVGAFSGSIAIISDAFNNLSDMGASVVSIASAKLSNQRPDADHPYGHGRFEYIASLFVAVMILIVGFELGKSSVMKIIEPTAVRLSPVPMLLLCLSVPVKLWMYGYNRSISRRIHSPVLKAAATDSLGDALSTAAVIVCTALGTLLPFSPDGYVGVLVCLLIFKAGLGILKETVDLLLGSAPDKELVARIEQIVTSGDGIIGIHDLIVNDYGPGRCIASVHAEVPANANIVRAHEVIDELEVRIREETGTVMVIHLDPVELDNPLVNDLRERVHSIVAEVDADYSMHDFRITEGEERINLIFDVAVPVDTPAEKIRRDVEEIARLVAEQDGRCRCVISLDTYVPRG